MAKRNRPRRGSTAFWPKGRAKRIYPRLKCKIAEEKAIPLGFAGYKAGMTRAIILDMKKGSATHGQEVVKPVTILDIPSLNVIGLKCYKKTTDGLSDKGIIWCEKIDAEVKRKMSIPKNPKPDFSRLEGIDDVRLLVQTQPKNTGIGKKRPEVFEIPLGGKLEQKIAFAKEKLGKEIRLDEIFQPGEYVDVIAVTKGKGLEGPVRRFGVKIRPRKHQGKRRHGGVLGAENQGKVLPVVIPMAGQLGFQTRTEYNKQILQIGKGGIQPKGGWLGYSPVPGDYLVLAGSVPGPKKRLVLLRKAYRAKAPAAFELKKIILDSLQGK
ncbi:MAG: 50S ribosomal protein L3 [Candidatus Aenigmatarchaeota archaeon]